MCVRYIHHRYGDLTNFARGMAALVVGLLAYLIVTNIVTNLVYNASMSHMELAWDNIQTKGLSWRRGCLLLVSPVRDAFEAVTALGLRLFLSVLIIGSAVCGILFGKDRLNVH